MDSVLNGTLGASPEVAREMIMADRNRHFANLVYDSFFESELKSFGLTLVEQRQNLLHIYGCSTSNDIRPITLVLLNVTDTLLQLFSIKACSLPKIPRDSVKKKMRITASIPLAPGEKNTRRYGVHGSNVMDHYLCGDRAQKVVKSDTSIDSTSAR